jgi:hypothetical protein
MTAVAEPEEEKRRRTRTILSRFKCWNARIFVNQPRYHYLGVGELVSDTLIPYEIRAEAEETVKHGAHNATQHNRCQHSDRSD